MTREEKEKVICEVVAWCKERNIDIYRYRDIDIQAGIEWPDMTLFNGCYIRVGNLTVCDEYLQREDGVVLLRGYTAEGIERAIENYERERVKLDNITKK